MDSGAAAGMGIVRAAVGWAGEVLGERLRAAYAIGSLAHGGFVAEVSDVDLALIVDRADGSAGRVVEAVRRSAVREYEGSELGPLAGRLSIFWSDWESLGRGAEAGRFPATDRLDLLDSGALVYGEDRRAGCVRPSGADLLLDSAGFAAARFGEPDYLAMLNDPAGLARRGARPVTKAVLFPVRLLYTAATGELGRNDRAARWYAGTPGVSATLVGHAARWRAEGIDDEALAADLLRRELLPLYRHCAGDLGRRVAGAGHPDLAAKLAALRELL